MALVSDTPKRFRFLNAEWFGTFPMTPLLSGNCERSGELDGIILQNTTVEFHPHLASLVSMF